MANTKADDVQPLAVEEVIRARGGRLGDKTCTLPYEVPQVGEGVVRIFKIRERIMRCLIPWTPAANHRAEVSSEILFKVQMKFQEAILAHCREKSGNEAEGLAL